MSESASSPPQTPLSKEQESIALAYLDGALCRLIMWMHEDKSSRSSEQWALALEQMMTAAEHYAREGR